MHNILIVHSGWDLPWPKLLANSVVAAGHIPYYLVPFKPTENFDRLIDGSEIYKPFMFPSPDINKFDDILDKYDISIVLFFACYVSQERCLHDFIMARNLLTQKTGSNKKLVDVFTIEIGFIRDINFQADPIGPCFYNSIILDKHAKDPLTATQQQEWNVFVDRIKLRKFGDVKQYSRREICSILNISEDKKLIFCPLQMPRDALLEFQTRWCHGIIEYIYACCYLFEDHDKFHLIFKQHPAYKYRPDSFVTWSINKFKSTNVSLLDQDHEINTASFLLNCDTTVTVNSSAGLEALIFDKPVIALGRNAWSEVAIWWNMPDDRNHYDHDIELFYRSDKIAQRKAFLYNLMFNYSVTFKEDTGCHQEIIDFINKKLLYHQL